MTERKLENSFFLVLLGGIVILTFFILLPFLGSVALGITLAVLFYPAYKRVLSGIRSDTISAILSSLLVLAVVFAPIVFFGYRMFLEAQSLLSTITDQRSTLSAFITNLQQNPLLMQYFPGQSIDVGQYARQTLSFIAQNLGNVFSGAAQIGVGAIITLLTLYYTFKDGPKFRRAVTSLSPLTDKHDSVIFQRLHVAVNSVIRGSLLIALLQGISTGVGFLIFGVPHAALWGGVAAVAALIPSVGTSLVLTPAIIFLFLTNQVGSAIGLLIWGITAVGLIDNFLSPKLIERGLRIHPLFILLSVIGGIGLFGPLGFLLGPLTLSLLFALLDIYRVLFPEAA